ncbi:hypothetical protein [Kitasatospora cathayae]|uniref:Conjugal transfer protein TraB n=1 Tax=Kitasatospora cathayae TaxID=3004092 RepID=A0ABY7QJE7_9ACTN|nr:hypothetical protein [Kitasatospora sp. HUAS 3-15]WBP91986.1 hypothetical protein O1G21_40050 [Kitasatospora sp. HUAS 3-15]
MSDLLPATRQAVGAAVEVVADGVRYGILIARLAKAGLALRHMAALAKSTFEYVGDCAASVDQLAEMASGMDVDAGTVAEHHEAANIMRGALANATTMAQECEEMSSLFDEASAAHQADYGAVAEAFQNMPVEPANREFYANR